MDPLSFFSVFRILMHTMSFGWSSFFYFYFYSFNTHTQCKGEEIGYIVTGEKKNLHRCIIIVFYYQYEKTSIRDGYIHRHKHWIHTYTHSFYTYRDSMDEMNVFLSVIMMALIQLMHKLWKEKEREREWRLRSLRRWSGNLSLLT